MAPRPILQDGPSDHGAASWAAQRRRPAPSHSPRHTNHARNLLPSHSLALRQFNSSDSFTSNDKNRPKGSFGFCRFCTIQDNDPRVVFSEGWLLRGTTFNTTHSTTQAGATASLRFKGRKIMVLGTVPVSNTTVKPPTVKYTISGQPPVQSTLPMANTEIRGQSFFHAMDIDEQEQTLTIEIVEAQSPFTLDSFFVTPHRNNGDSDDDNDQDDSGFDPTPNGMQFSSTLTTIIGTTPVTLPTPDPYTDQTSFPAQNSTPTNLVPVLAGLVGGLVAVIVIGLVLFCIRRRRRRIRSAPEFWRNWYWRSSPRPETIYTHWTSTESIQRDEPSWLQRGSSAFTRSEGPPSDLRVSTIDQRFSLASPLPPLPTLLLKSPLPPLPTLSKSDL